MDDATPERGGQKSVIEVFKLGLLDGSLSCSAVHQPMAESRQELTGRPLPFIQFIGCDDQAIVHAKVTKLSGMTNPSTTIVHMDGFSVPR